MQPISVSASKETAGAVTSAAFEKIAKGDVTPVRPLPYFLPSLSKLLRRL